MTDRPFTPTAPDFGLARRFDHAPALTIGLEEEVILLDPTSFLPVDAVEDALLRVGGDSRFKPELRRAQLELATPPASTVADVVRELTAARHFLVERLRADFRCLAVGTHPTWTGVSGVTARPRYGKVGAEVRWLSPSALPCGLHVHVAVDGADRALAVYNALRSYLPEIAALAANSPFFEGRDTCLASTRLKLTEDNPRAGIPPAFASWREYTDFVAWAARGGVIRDPSFHWWDVRLNARHGTVEVRAPDAQTRIDDAAGIAAVCHSLVSSLVDRYDAGETLRVHDTHRIAENRWRALRDGLGGELVDLDDGTAVPTRERLRNLVGELGPWAAELGCERELEHAEALVRANGAERQRALEAAVGIEGLAGRLAVETSRPALALVEPLERARAVSPQR